MKAMTHSIRLALAFLLAGALGAGAQQMTLDTRTEPRAMNESTAAAPYELELGWRFVSVDGNEDMYRSQINERDGFLLRAFTLVTSDFGGRTGLFDHVRIDASELGAGPAGVFRLEAGRSGSFGLTVSYRQTEMYSALPRLANPFAGSGVVPGQHTLDLDRQTFDVDLELLRWRAITPFVGITQYESSGPGTTTYTVGGDDFLLGSDQDESETEIRAGFGFTWGPLAGRITQGWRSLDADQTLTLLAGSGNNPGAVLGRPVTATTLRRTEQTNLDAPFTNAFVSGDLGARVRLVADYVTLDAESEASEDETAAGSFVSFGLRRFFGGLEETVTSKADSRISRGGVRAEVVLFPNVDLIASYRMQERDLTGNALTRSLYTDTINFSGADPRDLTEMLASENALDREDTSVTAGVRARALGPVSLWAYYTQTDQDVTMTPSVEEIVVPGNQGGRYDRGIDTVELGGAFARGGLTFQASYRMDDADTAILRADYRDRTRTRVRAGWASPGGRVRLGALAERTDLENDAEGIGYDAELSRATGNVELALFAPLTAWASYSDFQATSEILIRRPATFATQTSLHDEDGEAIEGGLRYARGRYVLDASLSQYENEGTTPFSIDRYRVGAGVDLTARYGLAAEWVSDEYAEAAGWLCGVPVACAQAPGIGDYQADRFGLFFRIRR